GGSALLGLLRLLSNFRDEETLLADQLLRFFLSCRVDRVLDFASRVVHCLVLVGRHARSLLSLSRSSLFVKAAAAIIPLTSYASNPVESRIGGIELTVCALQSLMTTEPLR